jgi:hypothetical protein
MENFTCIADTNNKSVCSYNGTLTLTFISIIQTKNSNQFTLYISVFPPLYIFQTST